MSERNAWDKLRDLVNEMAENPDLVAEFREASEADRVKELLARGITLADLYMWLEYREKTNSEVEQAGVLAAGAIWAA